jgi:hypothetical protein
MSLPPLGVLATVALTLRGRKGFVSLFFSEFADTRDDRVKPGHIVLASPAELC